MSAFFVLLAGHLLAQAEVAAVGEARIVHFLDRTSFQARATVGGEWPKREGYAVQSDEGEVLALVSLREIIDCQTPQPEGPTCLLAGSQREMIFEVDRFLGQGFVLGGDVVRPLDLTKGPELYEGHTDLVIKDDPKVSARYKPLVSQGYAIGPTAAHLAEGERIMSFLGHYSYGLSNYWSVSTLIPANLFGAPNIATKFSLLRTDNESLSMGLSMAENQGRGEYTLALSLFWDSVSGEKQISHTALNIALGTWDLNAESENLTLLGSSSIQTGYEFLMSNWDRLILGPRYNFERNAVGGYIGYMWIWNHYHLLTTLNTADVASFKYSAKTGYFVTLDMYWRF